MKFIDTPAAEQDLSDVVAYLDHDGDLMVRVARGLSSATCLTQDGHLVQRMSFLPETAKDGRVFRRGDRLTIEF